MAKNANGVCVFCPTEHFSQGNGRFTTVTFNFSGLECHLHSLRTVSSGDCAELRLRVRAVGRHPAEHRHPMRVHQRRQAYSFSETVWILSDAVFLEISTVCDIGEAWLASGTALVSAPSLQKGIALEMELTIAEGTSSLGVTPRGQPKSAVCIFLCTTFGSSC